MDKYNTKTLEIKAKSKLFFISEDKIAETSNLPIIEVCQALDIPLIKEGSGYKALCPFHNEKTPSFKVDIKRNIAKCFGCGEGGGPIALTMKKNSLGFKDAVLFLAEKFNVSISKKELTDEERQQQLKRESLFIALEKAQEFFVQNLKGKALEYALSRWPSQTITDFGLGYAPEGWDNLLVFLKSNGISIDYAEEAGLIDRSNKGKIYDHFRERIIIPIYNRYGRTVGFSGRYIGHEEKQPKYINNKESVVFSKGNILFGLNFALKEIRENNFTYLGEGNADVIRLHSLGIVNAVAPMGTALADNQLKEIKNICKSIVFIPDTDEAGMKAVEKNAIKALEMGFLVSILILPNKDENDNPIKNDADSFFTDKEHFSQYQQQHTQDFIEWYFKKILKPGDRNQQAATIEKIVTLLTTDAGKNSLDNYLSALAKIVPDKKFWQRKVNEKATEEEKKKLKESKEINYDLVDKYGFYTKQNRIYFHTKNGWIKGANFQLEPLFHVTSIRDSKRLYRITNEHGICHTIELKQEEMIGLAKFKLRVESLGNFLWYLGEAELNKYKSYLYEVTDSCQEIFQLGWQKKGFWAWANGVFSGNFIAINELGIVEVKNEKYYLPALSSIYRNENELYATERKFVHLVDKDKISLFDYSAKLIELFGNNGIVGLCYTMACIYRDIIVKHQTFFPILDGFGQKGSGKTSMGECLTPLFFNGLKPINLRNATVAGISDFISQSRNTMIQLDEYKNTLEIEKIEVLKGIYDGAGRTRMNMDRDKKKETTNVDCGAYITGQEMPTLDIALFSRLVFLSFDSSEFGNSQKDELDKFKYYLKENGLTHITHEFLSIREQFTCNYSEGFSECSELINRKLNENVETRILNNWTILLATFRSIADRISVPFTFDKLTDIVIKGIKKQNGETKRNNEVGHFWNVIDLLIKENQIVNGNDFKIETTNTIKTDENTIYFDRSKKVLIIHYYKAISSYQKQCAATREKAMDEATLIHYLEVSKAFLGKKRNTRISTSVSTAHYYDIEMLGICQEPDEEADEENDKVKSEVIGKDNLPF